MCGFAGFAGSGTERDLKDMCRLLLHRGPDDQATKIYTDGPLPVYLGFRRLAIIDIAGGRQPMATQQDDLAVVFNGEIYNAAALRLELESRNHKFVSHHSDTEVLLHGYRQWGEGIIERLDGMFAFVLLDRNQQKLVLARDPYGKKPLYYTRTREGLAFSSELSSLCVHPSINVEIDCAAIAKYFAFGFIPAPATQYRRIAKLPPGTILNFNMTTGEIISKQYWRYQVRPGETPDGKPDDWAHHLRNLLRNAVEKRLRSDVPLGFFLSGGIDSSAILALAHDIHPDIAANSFTIGFDQPSYDERVGARSAAEFFGARHRETTLQWDQARSLVDGVLRRMDEPIADYSLLPNFLLSSFAREHVTVALSGDGGDELFAGYDTFAAMSMSRFYRRVVPHFLHRAFRVAAEYLPRGRENLSFDFKLRRALRGLDHDEPLWHAVWLGPAELAEVASVLGRPVTEEEVYGEVVERWRTCASINPTDRALEYYAYYYLGHDILPKVDRTSMMNSLEVRSPFLDRDIAQFVLRLPADVKHRGSVRKWILRKALENDLPASVLTKPKKGFGIPISHWLRYWPMPDRDLALEAGLDGDYLAERWRAHVSGKEDNRGLLWAWLCLDRCLGNHAEIRRNRNATLAA